MSLDHRSKAVLRFRLDWRSTLRIVILGAGVQGTVFAVRLAIAGHQVTLVSRPERAIELRQGGAAIQDVKTMRICTKMLPVLERLP
jgi:ketopantoate reductase